MANLSSLFSAQLIGAQGYQGAQGAQGYQGAQGAQGAQGTQYSSTSSLQVNTLGINVAAGPQGTITANGDIRAVGTVTAYYSDERLKEKLDGITDALAHLRGLQGFKYKANELAHSLGYQSSKTEVGLSAQQVQQVLPEVVELAPFDTRYENGEAMSISGQNYLTLHYERVIPLVIEAIKELDQQVQDIKTQIGSQG